MDLVLGTYLVGLMWIVDVRPWSLKCSKGIQSASSLPLTVWLVCSDMYCHNHMWDYLAWRCINYYQPLITFPCNAKIFNEKFMSN